MNLGDLLSSILQSEKIEGVEGKLLQRKRTGTIGIVIAVAGAIIQAVALVGNGDVLENLGALIVNLFTGQFDKLPFNQIVGILVLIIGFGIFFILRYTSFLIKESQEPFRYTFWIEPFNPVKTTKEESFIPSVNSRFSLLHHDVRERINERIKRFKLLEVKDTDSNKDSLNSHIHIRGDYAIREEEPGKWVIHVMPRVRIGPPGSPETLANPVKYTIENFKKSGDWIPIPENLFLDVEEYNQIVERIYSNIATQVYRQILSDVKGKIKLFPTNYMRHAALFYEAKDFERSNTLDSYDYALELYKEAETYFDTRLFKGRIFVNTPLLWRLSAKSQLMEARTRIGYSRCLFYKRAISAQSGRYTNTLFEVEDELNNAIRNLIGLHNQINKKLKIEQPPRNGNGNIKKEIDRQKMLKAFLSFPDDSAIRRNRPIFDRQRASLFDACTVGALVYSDLDCIRKAEDYLNVAKAIDPFQRKRDPLWLLAAAEIEPKLSEKLSLLRQATELAPDFQIAQFNLAFYSEMRLRMENKVSEEARSRSVIEEYKEVLKINPGNTGAIAAQGYLLWLLGELEEAKSEFEEGREIKARVQQTFIGEFNYGLARIAAEDKNFNESYDLYMQAVSADPGVGAYSTTPGSQVTSSFYAFMAPEILNRYKRFRETVESNIKEYLTKTPSPESSVLENKKDQISEHTLNAVYSFVLNDYGNACLTYFHRFGDSNRLNDAIKAFEKAIEKYSENPIAYYNLSNAYIERGLKSDEDKISKHLEKAERLLPSWPCIFVTSSQQSLQRIRDLEKQIKDAKEKVSSARESRIIEPEKMTSDQLDKSQTGELKVDNQVGLQAKGELNKKTEGQDASLESLNKELNEERTKLEKKFAEYVDKILKQTMFMSSSQDRIDYKGDGVNQLCSMKIQRDALSKLDEYDIEALRAWAELLSINSECGEACEATQRLCSEIQRYNPEDFDAARIIILLTFPSSVAESLESKKRRDSLNLMKEKAKESIRNQIMYSLGVDPTNYLFKTWATWSRESQCWYPENYDEAIKRNPDIAEYHFGRAEFYRKSREWDNAFNEYNCALKIESDNTTYKDGPRNLQLDLNDLGNEFYNKRSSKDAIAMYQKAIEVGPEDAVIQSNLSLAWEQVRTRGERLTAIGNAIDALNKALELDPENIDYLNKIKSLTLRSRIIIDHGEPTLNLSEIVKPIYVDLTSDLTPCILTEGTNDLSPEFQALIDSMKGRVRDKFKINLPGINFKQIEDVTIPDGTYIIRLAGKEFASGKISNDQRFCPSGIQFLTDRQVTALEDKNSTGFFGFWVNREDWMKTIQGALSLWEIGEYPLRHLEKIIEQNLVEFIDFQ